MLKYAKQMPIAALARMVPEHDTRSWQVGGHHVTPARAGSDLPLVTEIAVDETSVLRGQDDVSIFKDLQQRRVMFVSEGRFAAVQAFAADLRAHYGGPTNQIERVCCNMNPAFVKGTGEHMGSHPRRHHSG